MMPSDDTWSRFEKYTCPNPELGLELDISRMRFDDSFLVQMAEPLSKALDAMEDLERGGLANQDEKRMVGHYWLRAPDLAPDPDVQQEIDETIKAIKTFAARVHSGEITAPSGDEFYVALVIGIGGSALGPQLLADALGTDDDSVLMCFIDNTDPDGIDRVLSELEEVLAQTLVVVVSKSGGTKETRNGMLEVADRFRRAELDFAKQAVAITVEGSKLYCQAEQERWLATFSIWDWVGGRTSITSAVGLLPAALQGLDVDALLEGARACDVITRQRDVSLNPAAQLALMWHYAVTTQSKRNQVILPYKDRLTLLSKYLQQLIMESIGKRVDRQGEVVEQGLTVLGNKGSTDQHALIQQLREGVNDFFATFVTVRRDRVGDSIGVEGDATSGDFLSAFWQGTRTALTEAGRESITITLDDCSPKSLGVLIALFERAVGIYAELVNVNAYNQPGVEAGKQAADAVIELQDKILVQLARTKDAAMTAVEVAKAIEVPEKTEDVYHILRHLSANDDHGVTCTPAARSSEIRFQSNSK